MSLTGEESAFRMATGNITTELIERHRATLDKALEAIRTREYWSPYPEHPKAYGESGPADGKAAFESLIGHAFPLDQPGTDGSAVNGETSPYGIELDISYPHPDIDVLLPAMTAAVPDWRDAGTDMRAAVCIEILNRINARSHEFAHAIMHTTGQAFTMAFQAGGPHAQDRGLEAVAYAYVEQIRTPGEATWTKPQGKRPPLNMRKTFIAVPRGISLLIGCNTFPTWNGFPGLFASLATGNPVLIKPHPRAVLPLALTVAIARETLADAGFDPNLVCLAAETPGEGLAKPLALRPEVKIIDYTGSTEFGDWLETNARQAQVYTEKAGVNTVLIDSIDDYKGMLGNLAFSVSLYSGQMCTTPQNFLIPRGGIQTDTGHRTFDEVVSDLTAAVDKLLGDDARAHSLLGSIVNPDVLSRLDSAKSLGEVALTSRTLNNPEFPKATVRTPAMVKLDASKADDTAVLMSECFGPVSFAVAVDSTRDALDLLRRTVREKGAMTVSAYTTSSQVEADTESVCLDVCASLSLNLTGGVFVNQTAAFSDFHGTGGNPAANAALCDAAFVANRFRVVEVRRHM